MVLPMDSVTDLLRRRRLTQAKEASQLLYLAGARRVWLFGSLARGEVSDRRTDIDLAVEGLGKEIRQRLTQQLRSMLRCKVDVVGVEDSGPALRRAISEHRVILPAEVVASDSTQQQTADIPTSSLRRPKPVGLHQQRLQAVFDTLKSHGASSVLDLGCGTALLLERLADDSSFQRILGVDYSFGVLEAARKQLGLSRNSATGSGRVRLLHTLATNPDPRFIGYEAVTAVELVEHLDPVRLSAFEWVVFSYVRPTLFILTTPNAEYNVFMDAGDGPIVRHRDHRFEWTRDQFQAWIARAAGRTGYTWSFQGIGVEDLQFGAPTQMAVCIRQSKERKAEAGPVHSNDDW
jgi:predicted nucleotidyltransferase/2-polyprenyl-3-methyl-5-hydroxy-6-metoxy-1,4-benzoquinol methylase